MSELLPKPFDTSKTFSGGAGIFIQFEDAVTPIYLFAIIKLIITDVSFGIPIHLIKDMSILSLADWYIKRSYINPIEQLDYEHQLSSEQAQELLYKILKDKSIYDYSPLMNIGPILEVYKHYKMSIPVYIYSHNNDPNMEYYCQTHFSNLKLIYLYGELKDNIKKCVDNCTYIFSDINLLKQACELLKGSFANILLAGEYKYNYFGNCVLPKYNILELMNNNPFVVTGITSVVNTKTLAAALQILKVRERL